MKDVALAFFIFSVMCAVGIISYGATQNSEALQKKDIGIIHSGSDAVYEEVMNPDGIRGFSNTLNFKDSCFVADGSIFEVIMAVYKPADFEMGTDEHKEALVQLLRVVPTEGELESGEKICPQRTIFYMDYDVVDELVTEYQELEKEKAHMRSLLKEYGVYK